MKHAFLQTLFDHILHLKLSINHVFWQTLVTHLFVVYLGTSRWITREIIQYCNGIFVN